MRNVIFVAPFPLETTLRFIRAVARVPDVRLLGVMQEPPPPDEARLFAGLTRVEDALDTSQLVEGIKRLQAQYGDIHRILGILEPLQVQLAEARAELSVSGTDPVTAELFRDKARMKDALRAQGLPCAKHRLVKDWADAESFVREVGLPVVLKPPAGMACKATWRVNSLDELRQAVSAAGASPQRPVLAEEFLRGTEFSFETVTVEGEMRFHSLSKYTPGPLEVMENPWIQWVCVLPRDISGPEWNDIREVGRRAVKVLGLGTGFTHMEWFRREDGSLAIGEIAARPPGANIVRMTGLAHDADMYLAWARAVVDGAFDGPWERKWAVGCAYLRGVGRGRVVRVQGVEKIHALVGQWVAEAKLPTLGAPKSDSYEGDGYVIIRHPDTQFVERAMKAVIETVQVQYG